jgi:hypothetical protein
MQEEEETAVINFPLAFKFVTVNKLFFPWEIFNYNSACWSEVVKK